MREFDSALKSEMAATGQNLSQKKTTSPWVNSIVRLISMAVVSASCQTLAADCAQGLFFIDPSVATTGSGTSSQPFKTWPQVLKAGACYLQKDGTTFTGNVIITSAPGTASAPIIMGGYGSGSNPVINGTIDLQASSHLSVVGFTITGSSYPGIVIEKGSQNVAVLKNSITGCFGGINLTNGALGGHVIAGNLIYNNLNGSDQFPPFGIGVYHIGNTASSPTVIQGNTIFGNGGSGIELFGNYNYVQSNTVYQNGQNTAGSSGIHVFAGSKESPQPQYGNNNLIAQNVVVANRDSWQQDGNGIQLDQYANHNQVFQNLSMLNDGPGISIYDSNSNSIADNQLLGNGADSGGTHLFRTEFLVASSSSDQLNLSKNNVIAGNQIVVLRPLVVTVLVDASSAVSTQGNIFAGNYLYGSSGANLFSWAGSFGAQGSDWNQKIATEGGTGDFFSGLSLSAATVPMQYSFGANGAPLTLDGKHVVLLGWAPGAGFIKQ